MECGIDMQHGHAARTCSMDMQQEHEERPCSRDMQHGHGHSAWIAAGHAALITPPPPHTHKHTSEINDREIMLSPT
jgi:hypothetical protein